MAQLDSSWIHLNPAVPAAQARGQGGVSPVHPRVGIPGPSGPAYVWVEETMEMVGVTFLLWGAFALAEREGILAFVVAQHEGATRIVKPSREPTQD